MARLEEYANKYESVRLERRDGILQMTFHTNGDTLQWGEIPHREFSQAFNDIGSDPDNRVVIMTGVGEAFSAPRVAPGSPSLALSSKVTPMSWDKILWEGKQLLMKLLDIEVPMISAVNGPCMRHTELPLLCDIVLASEDASFEDKAHFPNALVPGDGVHVVYPLLLGINRARYFHLTGQVLSAQKAYEFGLVAEVLPKQNVLPRAWELAEELAKQPTLVLRYSRVALTMYLKRYMQDMLGYGLALEGLGAVDATSGDGG